MSSSERTAANTGASSTPSGTSQAIRASASISGPPSEPRMVAMAPSITYSATRSSSTCDARSRSPTAGPAGASGSPAAIRSDCSEVIERICSVDRPTWTAERSWKMADISGCP